MVQQFGIEFTESAGKHGFTLDDVLYAARHIIHKRTYQENGETYLKITGRHHGDLLVPSLEIIMKITGSGQLVVFHANAEQAGFLDRGQERNNDERR
ncbi:hypothetical protein [Bifidobacterium tibiigranuli]|jgi:hypothetical protein|uniref:hypothetical protein n=1 Tax=Bifidobacterium tibiigranuli TaxID=2172043 RepID=UPI0026EB60DF|nr:hypothetical protein [Bifidobacterium tibiigranuli]MCI1650166.1 hypothetical protein [Bifidobacterium tibiigranuli]MCI2184759.1 hypothetical protein [Bifidobacterium tibiigranuli]MCI2204553.1 hypothetical protein [Bifidobacterium tibiigranuli]